MTPLLSPALREALHSRLEGLCQRSVASAGTVVFRAGDECRGIHWVERGTMGLRKMTPSGKSVLTRLVHAGEPLGHRTYFAGGPYCSTAVVLSEGELCFLQRGEVEELLRADPELSQRFLRMLARDVRRAEEGQLAALAVPLRGRLVRLLLDLADRYGQDLGALGLGLMLPLGRGDMAELIGARPESIARGMRGLEDEGLIEVEGRRLRIPSLEALVGQD